MIKKEDLIKRIVDSIITEENAVMLYSQHLQAIIPWSGVSKKKQIEIKNILEILNNESSEHKIILTAIKNQIEKDPRDVY